MYKKKIWLKKLGCLYKQKYFKQNNALLHMIILIAMILLCYRYTSTYVCLRSI